MRAAELTRFVGIERCVDPAKHDGRARFAQRGADLVAAQRVPGVDSDPDNVARADDRSIEQLERFVVNAGIAITRGRGARKHEEPAWRDDSDSKRNVTGVHKVNGHGLLVREKTINTDRREEG